MVSDTDPIVIDRLQNRLTAIVGTEGPALPSARRRGSGAALAGAVAVLATLVAAGGYLGYGRTPGPASVVETGPGAMQSDAETAAQETGPAEAQGYAGPLCYGPGRNEKARCLRARATIAGGKITGRWPGARGSSVIVSGEVAATGDATLEIRGENPDGSRVFTVNLTGALQAGRLDATGSFRNGRTASLNWSRLN